MAYQRQILYGTTNPMAMNMDITQVGPITVVVEHDTPSSCVSTGKQSLVLDQVNDQQILDMSKATAERSLVVFFGERAFACMVEAHAGWEILE